MSAESDFWRNQGYEWVEGGEGGRWQYTGRFPEPAPAPDKSLGQYKIAAEGMPKTFYKAPSLGTYDYEPGGLGSTTVPITLPATVEEWAAWTPTNLYTLREGGEGSNLEYAVNPYQETAKLIAAQPTSISPNDLVRQYPSLAQLPASTINAIAGDWRNVYGQMTGFLSPAKTKEGYEPFRSIVQQGVPTLSVGGEGELFAEALPYVTYSPEYGLVVPQNAYRPYTNKRSGLRGLLPSLALGAMFGPLAGALGGGIAGALGAGALTGGISASLNDGDILKGALTGGATAGLGQAVAPALDSVLNAADITGSAASAIKAGTIAAGKAALTGGDPLQSALTAAAGAGVGSEVAGLDVLKDLDPTVARAITAAASGAARAAVSGGDPLQSALSGAINTTLGGLTAGTVAPTTPTVPPAQYAQATGTMLDVPVVDVPEMTVDELIDEMLARQELITELPSFEYATPTEQYIDAGGLAIPAQSGLYDATGRAITKDEYSTFTGPMFDEQGQMVVEAGEGLAAPQGEIEVAGTAPTYDDLLAQLMQQDEERAGMEAALLGYDQRLIDALEQQEAEKAALQKALENVGASQEAQRGQISGIQTGIGQLASGLINRLGTTQQQITQAQQHAARAQQQSDLSNLLMMLGIAQQQKKETPPVPVVGEIKPFEFSTDLLEDIYAPRRRGLLGANDQLLNMTRG